MLHDSCFTIPVHNPLLLRRLDHKRRRRSMEQRGTDLLQNMEQMGQKLLMFVKVSDVLCICVHGVVVKGYCLFVRLWQCRKYGTQAHGMEVGRSVGFRSPWKRTFSVADLGGGGSRPPALGDGPTVTWYNKSAVFIKNNQAHSNSVKFINYKCVHIMFTVLTL